MANKEIPSKKLTEAFKAINLFLEMEKKTKLKYVATKKPVQVKTITKAIEAEIANDNASNLPEVVIDFYNDFLTDADGDDEKKTVKEDAEGKKEKTSKKDKNKKTSKKDKNASKKNSKKAEAKADKTGKKKEKDKKTKETKKSPVGVKNPKVAKRNALMAKLIATGKYTKKEVVAKVAKKFTEVTESTISTSVQDSMNPKYNKLEKLTIKDAKTGKLSCEKD